MQSILAGVQRMPRDLRLYSLALGLMGFGYFGIFGVLFNLYLLRLGYGTETIGLLVGVGQLVWGLAALPAGMIGVRFGNRAAMIWGIWLTALAIALLLCAELLPAPMRTAWITVWWSASWTGSALYLVNGSPYVMAICEVEERRNVFSIQQAVLGLCGFAGSLVAGVLPGYLATLSGHGLESPTVYWVTLWLGPLSYMLAAFTLLRTHPLPPVARNVESHTDTKLPLLIVLFVGLLVFLQTSGEGTIRAFFNVYLDSALNVPIAHIGVVMGLGQFLPILSSLSAPWVLTRFGTERTIIVATLVSGVFMASLALFANWVVASVSYVVVLLVISVTAIARNIFSQEIVAPQWRTFMSSVFTVGLAVGWASAAGAGGYLIKAFGYTTLFLMGALLAALSVILLVAYLRATARTRAVVAAQLPTAEAGANE